MSLLLICPLLCYGQKIITMEPYNGVYRLSCSINGAKMKMVFDTGASTVSLSKTMASYLYDNEYLRDEDYLGKCQIFTANGESQDVPVFNLRDIEIQGVHLRNVKATVIDGQNVPLLLGQTAISQLGRVTLDRNRIIINDYGENLDEIQISKLDKQIQFYIENSNWAALKDALCKLRENRKLSSSYWTMLVIANYWLGDYQEAINEGIEWEKEYQYKNPDKYDYGNVCYFVAESYVNEKDYSKALLYYEKSLSGYNDPIQGSTESSIAYCYEMMNNNENAIMFCKKSIKKRCKQLKILPEKIVRGINDETIGNVLYIYAVCEWGLNEDEQGNYLMALSAQCGNKMAIESCHKYGIKKTSGYFYLIK